MSTHVSMEDFLHKTMQRLMKSQENLLMEQLKELVDRDLLVIETTTPVIVRDVDSDQFSLKQMVRFKLKDQEYIEKLEKENFELKAQIENLKEAFRGLNNG